MVLYSLDVNGLCDYSFIQTLYLIITVFFRGEQIVLLQTYEPVHEISNNVICATSKASDQPAQTGRLIRAFASHLSIL